MIDMERSPERGFKGIWIPKHIWESPDLPILAKVLFAEIDSLDKERGCFASNAYFAKFFGVTDRAIRKHLAVLKERNFIRISMKHGNDRVIEVQWKYSTKARSKAAKELSDAQRALVDRFKMRS